MTAKPHGAVLCIANEWQELNTGVLPSRKVVVRRFIYWVSTIQIESFPSTGGGRLWVSKADGWRELCCGACTAAVHHGGHGGKAPADIPCYRACLLKHASRATRIIIFGYNYTDSYRFKFIPGLQYVHTLHIYTVRGSREASCAPGLEPKKQSPQARTRRTR